MSKKIKGKKVSQLSLQKNRLVMAFQRRMENSWNAWPPCVTHEAHLLHAKKDIFMVGGMVSKSPYV